MIGKAIDKLENEPPEGILLNLRIERAKVGDYRIFYVIYQIPEEINVQFVKADAIKGCYVAMRGVINH